MGLRTVVHTPVFGRIPRIRRSRRTLSEAAPSGLAAIDCERKSWLRP